MDLQHGLGVPAPAASPSISLEYLESLALPFWMLELFCVGLEPIIWLEVDGYLRHSRLLKGLDACKAPHLDVKWLWSIAFSFMSILGCIAVGLLASLN
jgi:hypothetical protein